MALLIHSNQGREDMVKTEFSSLQKRILASVVMVPFVIGALYAGHPYLDTLIFLVGTILSWEWSSMIPNQKQNVYATAYTFALGCSLLIFDKYFLAFSILATAVFIYIKAAKEKHRLLLALGAPYISIGIGALYWIYYLFDSLGDVVYENAGFVMTLWYLLMVWSVDIGAYIVGSSLRGPKLAPKISPNKTWSGLIGGVLSSIIVSCIFWFSTASLLALQMTLIAQIKFAVFGAVIAVVAQIGDLIESSIKRHLNVKDSSSLIPGHGGIFDRVDGLIFAAPFVYIIFILTSFGN